MEPAAGWDGRFVPVGGLRTFVRASRGEGQATPLLHLHGFGISGSYLMPTAQLLAARARNVVPDLPGYGRSEKPRRPLTIPQLADASVRVLDACGIEKAVLVGNSMGCPVGIEVADRYPDRVERLVIVSPAGGRHNQPLVKAVGQLALDALRESPRMAAIAVPDYLRFGPVSTLRLFRSMTAYPALDRLQSRHAPTLAVFGGRDPLVPGRRRVVEVADRMPGHTSVVVIERAAHAVNFSHPRELAHVIEAWLDGGELDGGEVAGGEADAGGVDGGPARRGRTGVVTVRRGT